MGLDSIILQLVYYIIIVEWWVKNLTSSTIDKYS